MSFILKCLTPSSRVPTQAVRWGALAISPRRFIGTTQTTEDEVVVLPDIDVSSCLVLVNSR
jgi:hypothetical protein